MMRRCWYRIGHRDLRISDILTLMTLMLAPAWASQAEPLDLSNDSPRWVSVEFEVSPTDQPGQFDSQYTLPYPAWVEPINEGRHLRVSIASAVSEKLVRERRPIPGTFSDFIWVFDRRTGEVLSAGFTGRLHERVEWGWISTSAEADIRVEMTSHEVAGFRGTQNFFGNHINRYCVDPSERCTLVEGRGLDTSGYTNAVGKVTAESGVMSVETFSPLGEAIFSESQAMLSAVASPPPVLSVSAELETEGN